MLQYMAAYYNIVYFRAFFKKRNSIPYIKSDIFFILISVSNRNQIRIIVYSYNFLAKI